MVKVTVGPKMPSTIVTIATSVKPGLRRKVRPASRTSRNKLSMTFRPRMSCSSAMGPERCSWMAVVRDALIIALADETSAIEAQTDRPSHESCPLILTNSAMSTRLRRFPVTKRRNALISNPRTPSTTCAVKGRRPCW
jgi:hypothetical protein